MDPVVPDQEFKPVTDTLSKAISPGIEPSSVTAQSAYCSTDPQWQVVCS